MAYVSKANLSDKDIRALEPQGKQYRKAVGHPSQLYIWVNPSGIKTFFILHKGKTRKLSQFKQGIYGVEQARDDALKIVKKLKVSGAELKSNKYTLGALLEQYLKRMHQRLCRKGKKAISGLYLAKI